MNKKRDKFAATIDFFLTEELISTIAKVYQNSKKASYFILYNGVYRVNGVINSKLRAMNIEELRLFCISKNKVTESFPFDDITLVFKVMNKMFALVNIEGDHSINLKCDPEIAIALRERYSSVLPGYHMNKKHWNTIKLDDSISDELVKAWIDDSYNLIVEKLPRKLKDELNQSGKYVVI